MILAAVRLLGAPPDAWSDLVAGDPNAVPSHRPGLWAAIAAVLPGMQPGFAAVESEGRLLGGAPVMVERRAGFTWLHALPWVLPGAPLAVTGAHARVDGAVAGALAERAASLGALGGEWALYRPRGPEVAPDARDLVPGETRWLETAVIDLDGGLDAAAHRVDRKTRRDVRHAGELGLAFAEEPGAFDEAYALYVAQSRQWPGHRPLPIELSRRLLGGAEPLGRLFVVRDTRGLLSAAFALDHPRETLVWWSGTHAAGRTRHAFAFLLWSMAEWAGRAGRARLNLGASPGLGAVAAFKQSLGARGITYPVRWFGPVRASWTGRLVAAAQGFRRRGRHRGDRA